ncbi:MAG: T9SS type A sorting domain-containing protein, partial [candidate division KSB1 bacterium]|nr:T9SS type A sorting domain-containing protein [candidate division KSB1 bacterium]
GYYACLIGANANTGIFRYWETPNDTSVLLNSISPRYLPTAGVPHRTQRFAFFICQEQHLRNIIREVELYFDYPYGSSLKENSENNIDYLFLLDLNGASAQNIIQLCQATGLGAVMLYMELWSDWRAQDEPFKLRPGIKLLVDSLMAAGLIVGLHSYVHLVPHNGYYAIRYPTQVSQTIIDGIFRSLTWTNTLPDSVAIHFAARVDSLNANWLYFDGNDRLLEMNGQHVTYLDPYLDARMTTRIMQELRQRNHDLKIFQSAGGTLCYPYLSRAGQVDYWDVHPVWGRTPIQEMDFIASQAVHRRRAFLYSDLGWFGRDIHTPPPQRRRDARWDEWQYLCNVSLNDNIPIGIRTSYNDFMTDPLRDSIVPLLRETIRQRRGLVGISSDETVLLQFHLEQNYPNPFNPTTTISFSLPLGSFVSLKVFDALGREVSTLVSEELAAGTYVRQWEAAGLPSGVYFYRLQAGSFTETKKLILLR